MIDVLIIFVINAAFFGPVIWAHFNPLIELEDGDI